MMFTMKSGTQRGVGRRRKRRVKVNERLRESLDGR